MKIHKIECHSIEKFLKDKSLKHEQVQIIPWPRGCGLAVHAQGRVYDLEAISEKIIEQEADQ